MSRFLIRRVAWLFLVFSFAFPLGASAHDAAAYFEANCAACHTIGGGKPPLDLAGVSSRKDRAWLVHFIQDPEGVVASGDVYAKELVQSADGMIMPRPDGMTPDLAQTLLAWIDQEFPAGQTFAHAAVDDRPFTPEDVARGRDLFTGARALTGRGPACMSCHALNGAAVAGGTLGPDLTLVHARLRGRAGLAAWLATPPTPVMRGVYRTAAITSDENRALVALFEDAATRQPPSPFPFSLRLLIVAVAVAVVVLTAMGIAWRGRLRAVRAPLVGAATPRVPSSSRTPLGIHGDRR
jgi:mono/diheme cytochrome c family protein